MNTHPASAISSGKLAYNDIFKGYPMPEKTAIPDEALQALADLSDDWDKEPKPPAPKIELSSHMSEFAIQEVERRMLTTYNREDSRPNTAFTDYMGNFMTSRPDVMLMTANSAVPLADSIRGWFDVTGEGIPELMYVNANSGNSFDIEQSFTDQEASRLRPRVLGARAVIFDQWIFSGHTLKYAEAITTQAGATCVGKTESTLWYQHAHDVDLDRLTSPASEFMRSIGRQAAEDYLS